MRAGVVFGLLYNTSRLGIQTKVKCLNCYGSVEGKFRVSMRAYSALYSLDNWHAFVTKTIVPFTEGSIHKRAS